MGQPYDPDRLQLFEGLMFALRDSVAEHRAAPPRSGDANATLAFFEAYFSNFIEGTEFTVDEAAEIVRSEEHTSELQSLMRISYAVFCLKNTTINILILPYIKTTNNNEINNNSH